MRVTFCGQPPGMPRFALPARTICAVAFWLCWMLALVGRTSAEDRLAVSLSREISPHWFDDGGAAGPIRPGPGKMVALGELNLSGGAPSRTSAFRLRSADNTVFPLHIDKGTLVREFGRIVFFRFFVVLPARLADEGGLVMEWGDDLRVENQVVSAIQADPTRPADYREMVFLPGGRAEPGAEEQHLDLKVVVDRRSSWYRLLYLLPILLVLAAAAARAVSNPEGSVP